MHRLYIHTLFQVGRKHRFLYYQEEHPHKGKPRADSRKKPGLRLAALSVGLPVGALFFPQ